MSKYNMWSLGIILHNYISTLCQSWFFDDNKYITSIKDVDNRENEVCWRCEGKMILLFEALNILNNDKIVRETFPVKTDIIL